MMPKLNNLNNIQITYVKCVSKHVIKKNRNIRFMIDILITKQQRNVYREGKGEE